MIVFKTIVLLFLVHWSASVPAATEVPAPLPWVVAESDLFEIVGRLDEKGLVLYVDRSATNVPVPAATLDIAADDRSVTARYDEASGTYRVDDPDWLAPLRQVGEHPLTFTLVAADDSDLLSGELTVVAAVMPVAHAQGKAAWLVWLVMGTGLAVALIWLVRRQGVRGSRV